jgi:two-component system OmpR family sensor kinase
LSAPRSATSYLDTLERVAGESERLRRIVEDLLWLARLDALPSGPAPTEIELATLAEQVVGRFGAIAAQRGLALRFAAPLGQPVLVLAPAEWIERLIGVLVDNACRYCRHGNRVEVTVTTAAGEAILLVDDDGPGFAESSEERLLERFHRASTVAGGAGLGLAIANAVQRATKGTISLGASPLGGARVLATWPLAFSERAGIGRLAHPSLRHGGGGRTPTTSTP